MLETIQKVLILFIPASTVLFIAGLIGSLIAEEKPVEIIEKECAVCESCPEVKETPICEQVDNSDCNEKLKNCWYSYSNDCNMDCVECEICEDFSPKKQKYLEEIDSILKSRDECRSNEGNLYNKLKECESRLPF